MIDNCRCLWTRHWRWVWILARPLLVRACLKQVVLPPKSLGRFGRHSHADFRSRGSPSDARRLVWRALVVAKYDSHYMSEAFADKALLAGDGLSRKYLLILPVKDVQLSDKLPPNVDRKKSFIRWTSFTGFFYLIEKFAQKSWNSRYEKSWLREGTIFTGCYPLDGIQ